MRYNCWGADLSLPGVTQCTISLAYALQGQCTMPRHKTLQCGRIKCIIKLEHSSTMRYIYRCADISLPGVTQCTINLPYALRGQCTMPRHKTFQRGRIKCIIKLEHSSTMGYNYRGADLSLPGVNQCTNSLACARKEHLNLRRENT